MEKITPEQIDEWLPQTQCGLCGYGGCMPYAEAIVFEKAPIHLCPPGGVTTLCALANLLHQDPTPFIADMEEKAKPPLLAVIRETECIGCTKCIQACPVDAILGSAKQMHTIIAAECTGCGLCVPSCPVDCIDMLQAPEKNPMVPQQERTNHFRRRFHARQKRLAQENKTKKQSTSDVTLQEKRNYIQAAISRAKAKKTQRA
jgi:electron transport complex protein RnfB